ncbi:uracil-DNA glycosylase [Lacihabitans soyangensis]|uniref:Uracil-DNA glycosylase n=1 Tax=Lacihabitans soyangensis TaxID=869394 RepID=A0AAE3H6V9_9BACT|nr:uracil-DNA glycosylase [Lacihabitans soyangensis]MCP9765091.1 uracil-DNA glycosylase [Lacihabitans soyangensis]
MNIKLEESWKVQLNDEFEKIYFQNLINFIKKEYTSTICYPPGRLIFNAFDKCPFDKTKVVILGQDPYHGPNQANGLCFSVSDGVSFPPSLVNIFKEIKNDLGIEIPRTGNLERWATQGVLLLNATLTVRDNQAGSHQKQGWETFTDAVISKLNQEKENLVFLLWGAFAQNKGKFIDTRKNLVLKSKHPSPLSANQGGWFDQHHFSQTNSFLESKGLESIKW